MDSFGAFFWGLAIGVWFMIGLDYFLPNKYELEYKRVVENCQKELPRSQKCVLAAVPEKNYKGEK